MSSCQDDLDDIGFLVNWLNDIETKGLGRAGWVQVKLDLIWALGTGRLSYKRL